MTARDYSDLTREIVPIKKILLDDKIIYFYYYVWETGVFARDNATGGGITAAIPGGAGAAAAPNHGERKGARGGV